MAQMVAFALKADYADAFTGGSVTLRGGEHYDVAAALKTGRGRIEIDDDRVIEALLSFEPLERVEVRPTRPTTTGRGA